MIGRVYWQSFNDSPKVSPREQPAISGNWWGTSSHASSKGPFIYFILLIILVRLDKIYVRVQFENVCPHWVQYIGRISMIVRKSTVAAELAGLGGQAAPPRFARAIYKMIEL